MYSQISCPLQWRHNGRDSVSNHQPHDCLLNRLFRHRLKKTAKLRVTGLCEGNSPGTGECPSHGASNAECFSIWWCHHATTMLFLVLIAMCLWKMFQAIWSYIHTTHEDTIPGSCLSQKCVFYSIHQRLPYFHLDIAHFHFIVIIHSIACSIFPHCLLSPNSHVARVYCLL